MEIKVGDVVQFELVHGGELAPRRIEVTVTEVGDAELPIAWFYGSTKAGVRYGLPKGFEGASRVL